MSSKNLVASEFLYGTTQKSSNNSTYINLGAALFVQFAKEDPLCVGIHFAVFGTFNMEPQYWKRPHIFLKLGSFRELLGMQSSTNYVRGRLWVGFKLLFGCCLYAFPFSLLALQLFFPLHSFFDLSDRASSIFSYIIFFTFYAPIWFLNLNNKFHWAVCFDFFFFSLCCFHIFIFYSISTKIQCLKV